MKKKLAAKSFCNSYLLATLVSSVIANTVSAQSPGVFSNLRIGSAAGGTTGDGTFVAEGSSASPTLLSVYQTEGTRMLWYPQKGVFRMGFGTSETWNELNFGEYSTAMGWANVASGGFSTALGIDNTARGSASFATGYITTAIGAASTTMGLFTTATSYGETVIGSNNANISGNPDVWRFNDPVFQIGNGHEELWESGYGIDLNGDGIIDPESVSIPAINSNALTVYKNGNMDLQGSLTLGGSITSAGSPVLTQSSALTSGFVKASSGGVINLTGASAGISANGIAIISINGTSPTAPITFASNRATNITATTPSSNAATGALTVAGGLGVGGSVHANADSFINGVRIGRGFGNQTTNTALGSNVLSSNSTGDYNTGTGISSLRKNTWGTRNSAVGANSLFSNTHGGSNSAVGVSSLSENITGSYNSAMGYQALLSNTSGQFNSSFGSQAGQFNTSGSQNVFLGSNAGSLQTSGGGLGDPENSIYIGASARGKDNNDHNSIVIGANAVGEGANTTVIGNLSTTKSHLFGDLEVSAIKAPSTLDAKLTLKGQVVLETAQGDISMGIYQ